MKRLNHFVRAYLFKRLLLPYSILICLNIFLMLLPNDTAIRLSFMIISAAIISGTSLWVILYPRLANIKPFHYLKYGQYLDDKAKYYHKKAKKKTKKIEKIKSFGTGRFVICQEHNLQESTEIANKLFEEDNKRKEEVLRDLYKELDFLKKKEEECKNLKKETKYAKLNPANQ